MASFLDSLTLIIKSINASWRTLFWSMMILFAIQWVCGMFLFQLLVPYMNDANEDKNSRAAVFRYYGTFTRTFISLFEATHVNYRSASRLLTDNISEEYAWLFIVYR